MEYIKDIFKKSGWMSILVSVIFAILGFILIYHPEGTVKFISYILGIIFIVTGIYKIINYIAAKGEYNLYNYDLIYGLLAVILGIVIMAYSSAIGTIYGIVIGIWIIYSALIRLSLSVKLKNIESGAWVASLIIALIMLVCGLFVVMNASVAIVATGVVMVVCSILDIIETVIFMKNVKEVF